MSAYKDAAARTSQLSIEVLCNAMVIESETKLLSTQLICLATVRTPNNAIVDTTMLLKSYILTPSHRFATFSKYELDNTVSRR